MSYFRAKEQYLHMSRTHYFSTKNTLPYVSPCALLKMAKQLLDKHLKFKQLFKHAKYHACGNTLFYKDYKGRIFNVRKIIIIN